jgi:hypothetical protein
VTPTVPLDAFFDQYYRRRPVNATFTGVHAFDGQLPDWSPEGLEASCGEMRVLRRDLERDVAQHTGPLFPDRVDLELAADFLDIQIAELESGHFQHRNPALFTGEAVFGVIALVTRDFAPLAERLEAAAARLAAIPAFLARARRTLGGRAVPSDWRSRALRECEGAAILFERGLPRLLAQEPVAEPLAASICTAAIGASAAFAEFAAWLARDPADATRIACGSDLFDRLLARGHRVRTSSTDLLREARERFDEAVARLDEAARRADPGGWPAVQARLAAQHPEPHAYLETFQQRWDACRAAALAHRLVSWPDFPIRYAPMPSHTRDAAPMLYYLSYRSPAPFDRLPVHDYVVPASCSQSVIALNHVVHHGAIGHHVQNCHAYRSPSRIGQIAAVDTASRIGMFSGGTLAEGWACYATDLMEEVGFLSDLECVAQQHNRVRQLARAIVDIELHRGTMSVEQAATFYRSRAGMSDEAARQEVTRNGMFPGTAIMYWIGTEGLHRLRAARARADAATFTLQALHDRVLSYGALPVPLITELMLGDAP